MIGIYGAFQQSYRLHHMGMSANNHVKAHITELLGHFLLCGISLEVIFFAPVEENHGGFRTLCLHFRKQGLHFVIELGRIGLSEKVHLALVFDRRQTVQREAAAVVLEGPGIGDHTDLNPVDLHNGVALFPGFLGTQGIQAGLPGNIQGSDNTIPHSVTGVVVGSQEHVISGFCRIGSQGIGAVKGRIALVNVLVTAEGGLQIGNGIVIGCDQILGVAENGLKIISAIPLTAGIKHRFVHQQVALGRNSGRGNNRLRLGRFRSGGRHRGFCGHFLGGFLGFCGQSNRLFGGLDMFGSQIHHINTQPHQKTGGCKDAQNHQHRNDSAQGTQTFGFTGHKMTSLFERIC